MREYIGLIHKDRASDYGVSFPDFPGCVTAGSSLEEARVLAQEALTLHVQGMLDDGEEIPGPSSLDSILSDPENRDSIAVLTVAPTQAPKSVRVNVTFPEDILGEIDRYAAGHGMSRSAFLAKAARRAIAREDA
jgi:predicted RNase H-like HicB family nuclease